MSAELPIPVVPAQMPSPARRPPSGPEWVHELEYDGIRLSCSIDGRNVKLHASNGEDWTERLPEVLDAVRGLRVRRAHLDGVVTTVTGDGTTSSEALSQAMQGGPRGGITYFVFDALRVGDRDLTALPLVDRKRECERLLSRRRSTALRYSEHFDSDGLTFLQRACELRAKGIVSKRRNASYQNGQSHDWLVTRCPARVATPHNRAATPRARTAAAPSASKARIRGLAITSPSRIIYPELRFDKLELAQFYSDIAEWILPYIAGRPLTLVRCEKGVRSASALRTECKFLRHEPGWHRWVSEPIQRVQIQEQKKLGEYLVVDSPEAVVALAQGNILEIHVWNSRVDDLERPDRAVFDLDPGDDVAWERVRDAASQLRSALEAVGLESWPKLTGGKGVHVVAPFRAEHPWSTVYDFTRAIAESLVRAEPETFTLAFQRRGREGRILVDYKRNHRAAVAVAAYSARAHPRGTVSVPISWPELEAAPGPDPFTVLNLRERLQHLQRDPWKALYASRQRLTAAALRA